MRTPSYWLTARRCGSPVTTKVARPSTGRGEGCVVIRVLADSGHLNGTRDELRPHDKVLTPERWVQVAPDVPADLGVR